MAFVYILQTESGKYYIGSTIDIKKRLQHHEGGHTPTTKRLGKIHLVFQQKYERIKDARRIERRLKKFKRKDFLDKIIKDGFI